MAPASRPRPRPRGTLAAVTAFILVGLACGEDPITPRLIDAPNAVVVAVTDGVTDAADRVAAQLDPAAGGTTLRARLTELAARIQARDEDGTRTALERARAALDVAEGSGPAPEAPDRSAIRLALDEVRLLLDRE